MKERANSLFPFAIACALPPAGLFLGLLAFDEDDRDLGFRLIGTAILAAGAWAVILLSLQ